MKKITSINSQTLMRHGHIIELDDKGFTTSLYKLKDEVSSHSLSMTPEDVEGGSLSPALENLHCVIFSRTRFDFEAIKQRSEFSDHGIWAINESELSYGHPFNRIVETVHSKRHRDHNARMGETSSIKVLVPLASTPEANWAMHVACHPEFPLVINSGVESLGLYETIEGVMPTLSAPAQIEVAANDMATLKVSIINAAIGEEAELFAESSGGYLPLTRIQTAKQAASFRFMPLGLSKGESVRVKFGFRFYTGLASTIVKVV
jgi:hypothetical protein